MFNENIALVVESTEQQVRKHFSMVTKNLNIISKNITKLLKNVDLGSDKELLNYLNESMSIGKKDSKDNIINLDFSNDYNSILNKINKYSYEYNTEKFNESLILRNRLIKIINDDLSESNIENGINAKNNIYKEINSDIELFKKEKQSVFISETGEIYTTLTFN